TQAWEQVSRRASALSVQETARPPPLLVLGSCQEFLRWLRRGLAAAQQHLDRSRDWGRVQNPLGSWANWPPESSLQQLVGSPVQPKVETLRHPLELEAGELNSPRDSVARNSQGVGPKNLSEKLVSVANWTSGTSGKGSLHCASAPIPGLRPVPMRRWSGEPIPYSICVLR